MHKKIIATLVIITVLSIQKVCAIENFGVYGSTYQILEPDMMEEIKKRNISLSREQMINKLKENLIVNISLPVSKERKRRIMRFSYRVKDNVIIDGNVIARKGDEINPLERMRLTERYIFMRQDQLSDLKHLFRDKRMRAVITEGNLNELIREHPDIRFYMASRSLLEMFQIKEDPTIVFQPDGEDYVIVQTIPIEGGDY